METATAVTTAEVEAAANFKSFNLHPLIEAGITGAAYSAPTPVQSRCIPSVLMGRDMIGLAHTGTGKTAAFVLPILQRLMNGPRQRPRALIVVPTRELADQIHEAIKQLGCRTKIKSTVVYGGVSKGPQIRNVTRNAEIIIACPGRLLDLAQNREINLSQIEVLVLDEADRMFDMGFLPDIRRIVGKLPDRRQTLLFSATMPADIRRLVQEILKDPVNVRIGDSAPLSTIDHAVYPVEQHLKTALLMRLLEGTDTDSVLIFTRTRHRATRLATQITRAGFGAASLQGNLPQTKRQAVLSGYRNGKYQILVATDIAARGIDISSISHVINYDMPDTVDAYTHRIGRTGRADRKGDAMTFMTRQERGFIWDIEKVLGKSIRKETLSDFNYCLPVPSGGHGEKQGPCKVGEALPSRRFPRKPARQGGQKKNFSSASRRSFKAGR